jgi:hypothetical protein
MKTKEKTFPKPTKPQSLKRIVKKILADPDYALFIHRQVLNARNGDTEAIRTVRAHFKPETAELSALNLKPSDFKAPAPCPGTSSFILLDFAAVHHGILGMKTLCMCPE